MKNVTVDSQGGQQNKLIELGVTVLWKNGDNMGKKGGMYKDI